MPTPPPELLGPDPLHPPASFTPADLESAALERLPALVGAEGPSAMRRFVEFFAARIRNPNTRRAYTQACGQHANCHTLRASAIRSCAARAPRSR
jgi:hypothetical protein